MMTPERLRALIGPRAHETYKLETFRASALTKPAYEAAKAFAHKTHNLLFCGPAGTGKSHLAVAAGRTPVEAGKAEFLLLEKPMGVSRRVRSADNAAQEADAINRYIKAPILIIDDLGVEKLTEFLASLLYEIVDGRYMEKSGGLIVTSNVGLDGLAERLGDDRIPSRLSQMCLRFNFSGEKDHRLNREGA